MSLAVREYTVAGIDLEKLAKDIAGYFGDDGYKTQIAKSESGYIVQATKEDILREAIASDRAFTITLTGDPQKVKVSVGVGKWQQNLAVEIIEGIIVSPLLFLLEVPVSLWSYEIEIELWHFIETKLGRPGTTPTVQADR